MLPGGDFFLLAEEAGEMVGLGMLLWWSLGGVWFVGVDGACHMLRGCGFDRFGAAVGGRVGGFRLRARLSVLVCGRYAVGVRL